MSFMSVPLSSSLVTPAIGPLPVDLPQLVTRLQPGMRLVVLMFEGSDTATHASAAPQQGGAPFPFDGLSECREADDDPAVPLHIATELAERAPHEALRIDEWADRFRGSGISARELTRGVRGGWIPHVRKGCGRDHKAQLIHPADMVRYLELREEGLRPGGSRPEWLGSVVMELPYVA